MKQRLVVPAPPLPDQREAGPIATGLLPPLPPRAGVPLPLLSQFHGETGAGKPDAPSDFERLVLQLACDGFDPGAAEALMAALTLPPPLREFSAPSALKARAVLVFDEPSAALTSADRAALDLALQAALDENPDASVLVLACNDGAENGWILGKTPANPRLIALPALTDLAEIAPLLAAAYTRADERAWPLFLSNLPMFTTGMPLYAGWGHTRDRLPRPAGRSAEVPLAALVEAAFLRLSSYRNPYTGAEISALEALDIRQDMARMLRQTAKIASFYRFPGWKHGIIGQMFPVDDPLHHHGFNHAVRAAQARKGGVAVWASAVEPEIVNEAAVAHVPLLRMEDGFVRSVGLGAAGYQPLSLVLDDRGIYYDCRTPSRLEAILNSAQFDARLVARAARLIETLSEFRISKYNLGGQKALPALPEGRKRILVPAQVEDDASILYGADGVKTLAHLKRVRAENPDAFILFKPHPDVASGLRAGLSDPKEAAPYADLFVDDMPILALIDAVDEVHTLTSLTGFEALLRGKTVVCYGRPFYAGWGLTEDRLPVDRRERSLTLAELVAATLILYPHYLDPVTGLPGSPEVAISRILDYRLKPAPPIPGLLIRSQLLRVRKHFRGLTARLWQKMMRKS